MDFVYDFFVLYSTSVITGFYALMEYLKNENSLVFLLRLPPYLLSLFSIYQSKSLILISQTCCLMYQLQSHLQ